MKAVRVGVKQMEGQHLWFNIIWPTQEKQYSSKMTTHKCNFPNIWYFHVSWIKRKETHSKKANLQYFITELHWALKFQI